MATLLHKVNIAIVRARASDLNIYQNSLKFAEYYKYKGSLELTGERPAVSKGIVKKMDTLQKLITGLPTDPAEEVYAHASVSKLVVFDYTLTGLPVLFAWAHYLLRA